MEGTVTISIKDYLELKEKAEVYEEQENKHLKIKNRITIQLEGLVETLETNENFQDDKELKELKESILDIVYELHG